MIEPNDYCVCNSRSSITTGFDDEFGYWDVCVNCGKRIESGHHYYNHYDGEDHEVFWGPNGEIVD